MKILGTVVKQVALAAILAVGRRLARKAAGKAASRLRGNARAGK